jgi:hypothetical protein
MKCGVTTAADVDCERYGSALFADGCTKCSPMKDAGCRTETRENRRDWRWSPNLSNRDPATPLTTCTQSHVVSSGGYLQRYQELGSSEGCVFSFSCSFSALRTSSDVDPILVCS